MRDEFAFTLLIAKAAMRRHPETCPRDVWADLVTQIIEQKLEEFVVAARGKFEKDVVERCADEIAKVANDTIKAIEERQAPDVTLH
jgi:hypothetical protein